MATTKLSGLASYTILSVSLPPTSSFATRATHYIYLRKDAPSTPTPDSARSLFLANIPIDASECALRAFFKQIGGALVERVEYEEELHGGPARRGGMLVKGQRWRDEAGELLQGSRKRKRDAVGAGEAGLTGWALPETWSVRVRRSGENAVVVFVDKATAEAVLKECRRLAKKKQSVPWTAVEELGLRRYKEHHRLTFPPRAELQQSVNNYLTQYAVLEAARNKKLKQLRSEPDADGFITVTRGGRTGPARTDEAQAAAEKMKEREKKRVGTTFYRFQTREDAKRKERELREKFENDARRLKDMRQRKGAIKPER